MQFYERLAQAADTEQRPLVNGKVFMTDSSRLPLSFPMPEIPGVTVPHGGLHFLKLKFQGTLIAATTEPSVQNMTLIGLALEFTALPS